ncbi:MAG: disulfide bond formation protein B [Alphaproteobacteria bacterium]|nr:MAG: disulfide bond formation protein B [Alphaproteobacteria bacterium]
MAILGKIRTYIPLWMRQNSLSVAVLTGFAWIMFVGSMLSEYLFNLLPCELCLYQRYVHFGIGIAGLLLVRRKDAGALLLLCLLYITSGALAGYHVGVQEKIFSMPAQCSRPLRAPSLEVLRTKILDRPAVRCDRPSVLIFGLSFAAYNALISIGLAFFAGIRYRFNGS